MTPNFAHKIAGADLAFFQGGGFTIVHEPI